jgi:hypothetical protein
VGGTGAGVAGTAGIEGDSTEAGTTDTGSIAPDTIDSTEVGGGLPVDTILGGCFRCRCLIRITDITVPAMGMGTGLVTGTDIDGQSLNRRFRKIAVRVENRLTLPYLHGMPELGSIDDVGPDNFHALERVCVCIGVQTADLI